MPASSSIQESDIDQGEAEAADDSSLSLALVRNNFMQNGINKGLKIIKGAVFLSLPLPSIHQICILTALSLFLPCSFMHPRTVTYFVDSNLNRRFEATKQALVTQGRGRHWANVGLQTPIDRVTMQSLDPAEA